MKRNTKHDANGAQESNLLHSLLTLTQPQLFLRLNRLCLTLDGSVKLERMLFEVGEKNKIIALSLTIEKNGKSFFIPMRWDM
jgi:hypothetical protein